MRLGSLNVRRVIMRLEELVYNDHVVNLFQRCSLNAFWQGMNILLFLLIALPYMRVLLTNMSYNFPKCDIYESEKHRTSRECSSLLQYMYLSGSFHLLKGNTIPRIWSSSYKKSFATGIEAHAGKLRNCNEQCSAKKELFTNSFELFFTHCRRC